MELQLLLNGEIGILQALEVLAGSVGLFKRVGLLAGGVRGLLIFGLLAGGELGVVGEEGDDGEGSILSLVFCIRRGV